MSDYHTDYTHVSQSMLKVFADRRRLYYKTYVTGELPPMEANRKMDLGTAAHAALLEPHRVDELVVTIPDDLLSGPNEAVSSHAAKKWVNDQKKAGKIPLKAKEVETVKRACRAILESDIAEWFNLPSKREHEIRWTDEATGVKCRMKGDILIDAGATMLGLDLKFTDDASPSGFYRVAKSCNYDLQEAQYRAGITAETGKPCDFYFVAIETSEPYAIGIHYCDDQPAADAYRAKLLADLKHCHDTGDWSEPWECKLNPFRIRKWD